MSPDHFWDLSWYEWGMYAMRIKHINDEKFQNWENGWSQIRELWTAIINVHMPKGKSFKRTDLIKLSFDKKSSPDTSKRKTPEEVEAKFLKKKK